jgi:hypothetical protein
MATMTNSREEWEAEREARHDMAAHADRPHSAEDAMARYLNVTAGSERTPDRPPSGRPPEPAAGPVPAGARSRRRKSVVARRFGYTVAVAVNAAMLYAVNVWPGWPAVPALTADTHQVLGLVNASLIAGLVVSGLYLAYDPLWLRAAGDLLTATIGLAALIRIWTVFPFDFSGYNVDWTVPLRVLMVVAIVGGALGIVVNVVTFAWRLIHQRRQG